MEKIKPHYANYSQNLSAFIQLIAFNRKKNYRQYTLNNLLTDGNIVSLLCICCPQKINGEYNYIHRSPKLWCGKSGKLY